MLSPACERDLHERLLARDPAAVNQCCVLYIPAVQALLRRRYRREEHAHLLEEAVDTAVFNYVKAPERYDPERLPLGAYLRMAAHRDFQTLLARDLRQTRLFAPVAAVELLADSRNTPGSEHEYEPPSGLTAERVFAELDRQLPDPADREVLRLMVIENVRETAEFARVLGIEQLDKRAQEAAVKRVKDRITKRLRRLGERLRGDTST